jgi:hypothetical protein
MNTIAGMKGFWILMLQLQYFSVEAMIINITAFNTFAMETTVNSGKAAINFKPTHRSL